MYEKQQKEAEARYETQRKEAEANYAKLQKEAEAKAAARELARDEEIRKAKQLRTVLPPHDAAVYYVK